MWSSLLGRLLVYPITSFSEYFLFFFFFFNPFFVWYHEYSLGADLCFSFIDFTETLACKSTANNSIRKVDIGFDLWLPDRLILLQYCFGYPVKTSPQMWKTPSELNITVINAVINITLKGTSLPPILVWMSYYVKSKLAQKTKIYYWQRKKERIKKT